jgi:serpin B
VLGTVRTRIAAVLSGLTLIVAVFAALGGGNAGASSPRKVPLGPGPVVPPPPLAGARVATSATNGLGLRLLPRLGGAGNVVLSPYSIATALAMVDQGAQGSTAREIGKVLGGASAGGLATSVAALGSSLRAAVTEHGSPGPTLDTANNLWVQSGFALGHAFTTTLSSDFGVTPQQTDFASSPDTARQAVNSWVAAHTQQLIPNLMPPGSITAATKLVLANAIYLKAKWEVPFQTTDTVNQAFHPAAGAAVQAPFMHETVDLPFRSTSSYVAVELPYARSTLSMLAVMPAAGTLPSFERGLTAARLSKLAASLTDREMAFAMPKLNLSLDTNLNGVLSALGMPIAFTGGADFRGISTAISLAIQDVEHDAVLKVDEAGTVAAAATGISIAPTAVEEPPALQVTLNRPYLLFLRDDATGAVLFAARVADPAS